MKYRLTKSAQLQASNAIATSPEEFSDLAMEFPEGTLFQHMGRQSSGDDCVEDSGMHGWCFSVEPMTWRYCNFHGYILDAAHTRPDLFELVEEEDK